MKPSSSPAPLLNLEPRTDTFMEDVLSGLSRRPRTLPCKYFYDKRGSQLFDRICELDEYYPTRTELAIMRRYASQMAEQIGSGAMVVEFGSGSSVKIRLLLDRLTGPVTYVPVDISREHLQANADRLSRKYPDVEILPVCADFTGDFRLPVPKRPVNRRIVYFPGSTIGNFGPAATSRMLGRIAEIAGPGGGLLIGIDLRKDVQTLELAYNDAQGVTAEFNLNLLRRINRELDADFDLDQFEHAASYDDVHGRVEIELISRRAQDVRVGDETFRFGEGEPIRTENSYKYTVEGFAELARPQGLTLRRHWTDDDEMFGVLLFDVEQA